MVDPIREKTEVSSVRVECPAMPKWAERDGFKLEYVGIGDNTHRHYPNSFIFSHVNFPQHFRKDIRRTDTVKAISNCWHVWEYVPITEA